MNQYNTLQSIGEWTGRDDSGTRFLRPTVFPPILQMNAQRAQNKVEVVVLGRQRTLTPLTQEFKNIRHDTVLDVLAGGGDEPLHRAGVVGEDGKLTPDFLNTDNKVMLELATTAISEEYSLDTEWERKVGKYKHIADRINYQLLIVVVSPTLIKCNFHLSNFEVNMLCFRVRMGLALESMINELMGQNMFVEDMTEKENMVEYIMKQMPLTAKSSELFDLNDILNTTQPVTESESKIFKSALRQTLEEASCCSKETDADLHNYLSGFHEEKCRTTRKRVSNIPFIYSKSECSHKMQLDPESSWDMPMHMKQLWQDAKQITSQILTYMDVLKEARGEVEWDKHRIQKQCAFNVSLSNEQKKECAKSGVFGKMFADDPDIQYKRKESQKSFSPHTDTTDIEDFINWKSLDTCKTNVPMGIRLLIKSSKELWDKKSMGLSLFNSIIQTPAICFAQTISQIMTEIAYCYRYWPKRADFYHKEVGGIHILVRSTGTHVFVSYAFPECCSEMIDSGRLGPDLYYSDNYIFTDFCSYDEPTLEHFVKAGPYMCGIVGHLLSHLELRPESSSLLNKDLGKTLNTIFLLYLNNKTDSEELATSQRYLVMGILEELDPNPYRFTSRLPEVLRSRLTVYLLNKTILLMKHYGSERIKKTVDSRYGKPEIQHSGLISLYSGSEISLKQQVNEFYFGYVISKERGRGADRNFKIIKKIIKEEYEARDTVQKTFNQSIKKQKFVSNPIVAKVMMSLFKSHMKGMYGPQWLAVLKRQIIRQLALGTFSDMATLKVAARSYKEKIIVPGILPGATVHEIMTEMSKLNPEEVEKRPKVMEALSELVARYILIENHSPTHLIQMLPFSFKLIMDKGYFDTDLFIKPQHGGDREIHVLEIAARVCQYHLEGIARAISRQIPEDSLTHPKSKDYFVSQHHKKAESELGSGYYTLCKSADATKWCQRNHVSKFACFMMPLLDRVFWNFVLSMLWIWLYKRMSFPLQFAANLMKNHKIQSDSLYMRFQKDFENGSGLFSEVKNNKMHIKFGMMQGILHFVSTLTHVIVMIVMSKIVIAYLRNKKISAVSSVISGSDDSGQMISVRGRPTVKALQLTTTMLHWKEKMAEYVSIYANRAKSSIGTLDLIEYNSEWNLREHSMKPTFRWVSACMETTVVERFIDRVRTMYNTLAQVLEGGGKTLECSIIQMSQAWLHYMMLGLHNNILSDEVCRKIWQTKDPSLGYFPLDADVASGIVGVDFQLYHLVTRTGFSKVGYRIADPEIIHEDEIKDSSVPDELRTTKLSFGSLKFWHGLLRKMKVPQLENIISVIENNPLIIFENNPNWEHCKYQIFLKVFQPGVKESLSSYSPTIRMMAATSYLISKQCFSKLIREEDKVIKKSLYQLLDIELAQMSTRKITTESLIKTFPYASEYKEMLEYIEMIETKGTLRKTPLKSSSKQTLMVFEKRIDDIPVVDMCRRKWNFSHHVPLSNRQFNESWSELKVKYDFLRDTLKGTCDKTEMNVIELKNFLESFTIKSRKIVLMDSAAKSSNLKSSISRIFWPDIKIEVPKQDEDTDSFALRSDIFSVLTFWGSSYWKKDQVSYLLHNAHLSDKQQVPQRVKKLQIISKWLHGVSCSEIIRDIDRLKLGVLGFFVKQQIRENGISYGDGIWAGKCMGVSINVMMSANPKDKENVCTEIVLDKLLEPKSLGKVLIDLVREFKLIKPKHYSKSELWLTDRGKIVNGEGESNDISIRIDPSLNVEFVDKLSEAAWDWQVTSSKIKLIAAIDEEIKITILSDEFSNRDWDPMTRGSLQGPVLSWSKGETLDLRSLQEEIITATGMSNSSVLKAATDYTLMTNSGWLIYDFVRVLKTFYEEDQNGVESEDISEISEDVANLMDFINLEYDTDSESNSLLSFGSESDDILNPDLFELDNVDEVDLILQDEIFDAIPLQRFGPGGHYWSMPKFNSFFSGLEALSRAMFKEGIPELIRQRPRPIPGILGVILTLMTRRPWCDDGISRELNVVMDHELDTITVVQSLKTDTEYSNLDRDKIESMIAEVQDLMDSASPSVQPLFRQQIIRLRRALVYKYRSKEPDNLTQVTIEQFFEKVCATQSPKIPRIDALNQMNSTMRTLFLRSLIQADLGKLEKETQISPHEMALMVEAINQPIITTLALDAVWKTWGIGCQVGNYKIGNCQIML
jgi:hypothetical protein